MVNPALLIREYIPYTFKIVLFIGFSSKGGAALNLLQTSKGWVKSNELITQFLALLPLSLLQIL